MSTTDFQPGGRVGPHWIYWLIAVVAVLWNSFGAFDYVMTKSQGAEYLGQMLTPEQVEVYMGMPIWATAGWATAIWTSVLGSICLLLRRAFAAPLFAIAIVGMVVSFSYQLFIAGEVARAGIGAAVLPAVIVAIGIFLLSYAMRQRAAGVLR